MPPLGIVLIVFLVLIGLTLVPFGDTHRSIADRVSPRSPTDPTNDKLG